MSDEDIVWNWELAEKCETCGVDLLTRHEGLAGKCYLCLDNLVRDRKEGSESESD